MANYDRRILVPYLQDVCITELLCRKIERDLENCRGEIRKYNAWATRKYSDPAIPNQKDYDTSDEFLNHLIPVCLFGGIPILVGIKLLGVSESETTILGVIAIAVGVLMCVIFGGEYIEIANSAQKEYEKSLAAYEEQVKQIKRNREKQPQWREQARKWEEYETTLKSRLRQAQKLRDDVYSVNIIPSRYRNIHVAYYLYDYFNSCRESDLDKIIQTMLLDEIVQKLDRIIVQNEQILLNQRFQMALQEQQNLAIAENHRRELKQLAKLERNQELQMDYQRMIERNQEVTNFFLAADYLRKK